MATKVIIVRHGESTFNVQGRVQGHGDASTLTERGIAAAKQVGQALLGIQVDQFYSSPLRRAYETALEISYQLQVSPPEKTDLLKEIFLPAWETLKFEEVKEKYPEAYQHWHSSPQDLRMDYETPDGTKTIYPLRDLFVQAQEFWQFLLEKHQGKTILLVGHSGINRALICTALGMGLEGYIRLQQANCAINVLNFPGAWGEPAQLEGFNLTSHLGDPFPTPRFKEQTLRLLLVRHGETNWNREGRFQGQIDVPLNENGLEQGAKAAKFLENAPFQFAITSPLLRPKATAEAILQFHPGLELALEPELAEISHGAWEGKLEPEVESEYPGEIERWRTVPHEVQMPEGENLQQVWDRAIQAWDQIIETAKNNPNYTKPIVGLVVAHDAINKVILCHVAGLGPEHFWQFKQGNGAVSVIDYPLAGGTPRLQAMNITTHLGGVLDRTAAGAL